MGIVDRFRKASDTASEFIDAVETSDVSLGQPDDHTKYDGLVTEYQLPDMKAPVGLHLRYVGPTTVAIENLQSYEVGQGDGTKMMNWLIEMASQMGVTLTVQPGSIGPKKKQIMNEMQLADWYQSFGFDYGDYGDLEL